MTASISFPTSDAQGWQPLQRLLSSVPTLLFAIRVWAAACLALFVAFWLQVDNAYWAATTAVIVSQPSLGASLRKSWFRMGGTIIGAVAIVILTACFPQNRLGFLLGLALWAAACGFVAATLRNFAAYGAALAGFTAAIIASDELGATGGLGGHVLLLALTRVSEICIGIVCAAVVLATTDLGRTRGRLADLYAAISGAIARGLVCTLKGADGGTTRAERRDLVRQTIALDPVIDEVMGEEPDLRLNSQPLRAAVEGLFVSLAGWRLVANHLEHVTGDWRRLDADIILQRLPAALRSGTGETDAVDWVEEAVRLRRTCTAAVKALVKLPAHTSSLRMMADGAAQGMMGLARSLDGIAVLAGRDRGEGNRQAAQLPVPDYLPALVNASRIFLMIGAVELFWIVTEWSSGALAIVWSTIFVIVHSLPGTDQPYDSARSRLLGIVAAAICAAIIKFAVLPGCETFTGLAIVIGVVLVPVAALSTLHWQPELFGFLALALIPLLKPENPISYDTVQYYNDALAVIAGAGASTLAFRLLPPPSPAFRAARLLWLTLRDLRRLAKMEATGSRAAWESLAYARLSVFPEQAGSLQRARLLAAVSVGSEIIRVRRMARRLGVAAELDSAFAPLAWAQSALASRRLEYLAGRLPTTLTGARARTVLRMQGSICAISEGLRWHATYFDARTINELR
ncbi:FUSC family protein [Bradyrhizobium uaiense]|uniref:FUSC family protein n=1 Tax=Bradyrhizobium uaiense TaxID=2594946 RepID=UPI0013D376E6